MDMMKVSLSNMRDQLQGLHASISCACTCEVCVGGDEGCCAHAKIYKRLTLLWMECVCPKQELDKWHKLACLMGTCDDCGVRRLKICPEELSTSTPALVKWKCFELTEVGVCEESGRPKKRIKEAFKETTPGDFVRYLMPKVQNFVTHNFVANWQDDQCKTMMESAPAGVLISHIDFAENYTFAIQNEVQSMHWFSTSISILVHITVWKGEATEPGQECEVFKQTHYYISDDKKHDSLFVQHCMMLHWEWLNAIGIRPSEHWVFSDGCAGQFKGATAMYFVARYPGLTGGCSMRWNYFGSGHGKGCNTPH
jgi:hypothetical protein